jgi:hypothetical protein
MDKLPLELVWKIMDYEGSVHYRNGKYINAYKGDTSHVTTVLHKHVYTCKEGSFYNFTVSLNDMFSLQYSISANAILYSVYKRGKYITGYIYSDKRQRWVKFTGFRDWNDILQ